MLTAREITSPGDAERHARFHYHEQLGSPLDRGNVGGAERGSGPEAQRQVVREPRHPRQPAAAADFTGGRAAGFRPGTTSQECYGSDRSPPPRQVSSSPSE